MAESFSVRGKARLDTTPAEKSLNRFIRKAEQIDLKLSIKERNFTQPLGRITGAADEFNKSLAASNARVIAFAASAGLMYSVQRALVAVTKSAIEVEHALAEINVILGASSTNLAKFGDALFKVAAQTGQAFSTVAIAATELARQGLSMEETLIRTKDAMILTRLAGMDAAAAVDALTASINSFNRVALTSTEIVNKMANVDAAFAVSTNDLAEALKRVGSSAIDAGVSFDQLMAMTTAVQQITARGGPVIGNSLKSIFTRIQRTEVLDQLEMLGVRVRNLKGDTLPAIQIMTALAKTIDNLSAAQRANITELMGGVFQINVVKAALSDLGKEYSIYDSALRTSVNSTDEAIKRNEKLNETLQSLVNKTFQNVKKAGAEIGRLTIAPALEGILEKVNKGLDRFDAKDSESTGNKIGKGILEGIGTFISGPGMIIGIAILGKLFQMFAKFASESFREFFQLNETLKKRATLERYIGQELAENEDLTQAILKGEISIGDAEKVILKNLELRTIQQEKLNRLIQTAATGLNKMGVTAKMVDPSEGTYAIKPPRKSRGNIPSYSRGDLEDLVKSELSNASYARSGTKAVIDTLPGLGLHIRNTEESVSYAPGMRAPFINPPINSPEGRIHRQQAIERTGWDPYSLSAWGGAVPNFAKTAKTNKNKRKDLTAGPDARGILLPEFGRNQNNQTFRATLAQVWSSPTKERQRWAEAGFSSFRLKGVKSARLRKAKNNDASYDAMLDSHFSPAMEKIGKEISGSNKGKIKSTTGKFSDFFDDNSWPQVRGRIFEASLNWVAVNMAGKAAKGRLEDMKGKSGRETWDFENIQNELARLYKISTGGTWDAKPNNDEGTQASIIKKVLNSRYKGKTIPKTSSGFIPNFAAAKKKGPTLDYAFLDSEVQRFKMGEMGQAQGLVRRITTSTAINEVQRRQLMARINNAKEARALTKTLPSPKLDGSKIGTMLVPKLGVSGMSGAAHPLPIDKDLSMAFLRKYVSAEHGLDWGTLNKKQKEKIYNKFKVSFPISQPKKGAAPNIVEDTRNSLKKTTRGFVASMRGPDDAATAVIGPYLDSHKGGTSSAAGAVFESGIKSAFGLDVGKTGDRFDAITNSSLKEAFSINSPYGEFKIDDNSPLRQSMASKILKQAMGKGLSRGFIPNFAQDPNRAREAQQAGVPYDQTYTSFVDTQRYKGPVVGNNEDEPTYKALMAAVKAHPNPRNAGLSAGFVPGFAEDPSLDKDYKMPEIGEGFEMPAAKAQEAWAAFLAEVGKTEQFTKEASAAVNDYWKALKKVNDAVHEVDKFTHSIDSLKKQLAGLGVDVESLENVDPELGEQQMDYVKPTAKKDATPEQAKALDEANQEHINLNVELDKEEQKLKDLEVEMRNVNAARSAELDIMELSQQALNSSTSQNEDAKQGIENITNATGKNNDETAKGYKLSGRMVQGTGKRKFKATTMGKVLTEADTLPGGPTLDAPGATQEYSEIMEKYVQDIRALEAKGADAKKIQDKINDGLEKIETMLAKYGLKLSKAATTETGKLSQGRTVGSKGGKVRKAGGKGAPMNRETGRQRTLAAFAGEQFGGAGAQKGGTSYSGDILTAEKAILMSLKKSKATRQKLEGLVSKQASTQTQINKLNDNIAEKRRIAARLLTEIGSLTNKEAVAGQNRNQIDAKIGKIKAQLARLQGEQAIDQAEAVRLVAKINSELTAQAASQAEATNQVNKLADAEKLRKKAVDKTRIANEKYAEKIDKARQQWSSEKHGVFSGWGARSKLKKILSQDVGDQAGDGKTNKAWDKREKTLEGMGFGKGPNQAAEARSSLQGAEQAASSAFQNKAMVAAMALPMALETAKQWFDQDTEGGRKGGVALEATSGIASMASAGAMFGGWGIAGGALLGILTEIPKAMDAWTDKSVDFQKTADKAAEKLTKWNNTSQDYLKNLTAFEQAIQDPAISADKLASRQKALQKSIMLIPDEFRTKMLAAQGNVEKIQEIFAEIQQDLARQQETAQSVASVAKAIEDIHTFWAGKGGEMLFGQPYSGGAVMGGGSPGGKWGAKGDPKAQAQFFEHFSKMIDISRLQGEGGDKRSKELQESISNIASPGGSSRFFSAMKDVGVGDSGIELLKDMYDLDPTNLAILSDEFTEFLKMTRGGIVVAGALAASMSVYKQRMAETTSETERWNQVLSQTKKQIEDITGTLESRFKFVNSLAQTNKGGLRNLGLGTVSGRTSVATPFVDASTKQQIDGLKRMADIEVKQVEAIEKLNSSVREKLLGALSINFNRLRQSNEKTKETQSKQQQTTNVKLTKQNILIEAYSAGIHDMVVHAQNQDMTWEQIRDEVTSSASFLSMNNNQQEEIRRDLTQAIQEGTQQMAQLTTEQEFETELAKQNNYYQKVIAENTKKIGQLGTVADFMKAGNDEMKGLTKSFTNYARSGLEMDAGMASSKAGLGILDLFRNFGGMSAESLPAGMRSRAVGGVQIDLERKLDLFENSMRQSGDADEEFNAEIENLRGQLGDIAETKVAAQLKDVPTHLQGIKDELTHLYDITKIIGAGAMKDHENALINVLGGKSQYITDPLNEIKGLLAIEKGAKQLKKAQTDYNKVADDLYKAEQNMQTHMSTMLSQIESATSGMSPEFKKSLGLDTVYSQGPKGARGKHISLDDLRQGKEQPRGRQDWLDINKQLKDMSGALNNMGLISRRELEKSHRANTGYNTRGGERMYGLPRDLDYFFNDQDLMNTPGAHTGMLPWQTTQGMKGTAKDLTTLGEGDNNFRYWLAQAVAEGMGGFEGGARNWGKGKFDESELRIRRPGHKPIPGGSSSMDEFGTDLVYQIMKGVTAGTIINAADAKKFLDKLDQEEYFGGNKMSREVTKREIVNVAGVVMTMMKTGKGSVPPGDYFKDQGYTDQKITQKTLELGPPGSWATAMGSDILKAFEPLEDWEGHKKIMAASKDLAGAHKNSAKLVTDERKALEALTKARQRITGTLDPSGTSVSGGLFAGAPGARAAFIGEFQEQASQAAESVEKLIGKEGFMDPTQETAAKTGIAAIGPLASGARGPAVEAALKAVKPDLKQYEMQPIIEAYKLQKSLEESMEAAVKIDKIHLATEKATKLAQIALMQSHKSSVETYIDKQKQLKIALMDAKGEGVAEYRKILSGLSYTDLLVEASTVHGIGGGTPTAAQVVEKANKNKEIAKVMKSRESRMKHIPIISGGPLSLIQKEKGGKRWEKDMAKYMQDLGLIKREKDDEFRKKIWGIVYPEEGEDEWGIFQEAINVLQQSSKLSDELINRYFKIGKPRTNKEIRSLNRGMKEKRLKALGDLRSGKTTSAQYLAALSRVDLDMTDKKHESGMMNSTQLATELKTNIEKALDAGDSDKIIGKLMIRLLTAKATFNDRDKGDFQRAIAEGLADGIMPKSGKPKSAAKKAAKQAADIMAKVNKMDLTPKHAKAYGQALSEYQNVENDFAAGLGSKAKRIAALNALFQSSLKSTKPGETERVYGEYIQALMNPLGKKDKFQERKTLMDTFSKKVLKKNIANPLLGGPVAGMDKFIQETTNKYNRQVENDKITEEGATALKNAEISLKASSLAMNEGRASTVKLSAAHKTYAEAMREHGGNQKKAKKALTAFADSLKGPFKWQDLQDIDQRAISKFAPQWMGHENLEDKVKKNTKKFNKMFTKGDIAKGSVEILQNAKTELDSAREKNKSGLLGTAEMTAALKKYSEAMDKHGVDTREAAKAFKEFGDSIATGFGIKDLREITKGALTQFAPQWMGKQNLQKMVKKIRDGFVEMFNAGDITHAAVKTLTNAKTELKTAKEKAKKGIITSEGLTKAYLKYLNVISGEEGGDLDKTKLAYEAFVQSIIGRRGKGKRLGDKDLINTRAKLIQANKGDVTKGNQAALIGHIENVTATTQGLFNRGQITGKSVAGLNTALVDWGEAQFNWQAGLLSAADLVRAGKTRFDASLKSGNIPMIKAALDDYIEDLSQHLKPQDYLKNQGDLIARHAKNVSKPNVEEYSARLKEISDEFTLAAEMGWMTQGAANILKESTAKFDAAQRNFAEGIITTTKFVSEAEKAFSSALQSGSVEDIGISLHNWYDSLGGTLTNDDAIVAAAASMKKLGGQVLYEDFWELAGTFEKIEKEYNKLINQGKITRASAMKLKESAKAFAIADTNFAQGLTTTAQFISAAEKQLDTILKEGGPMRKIKKATKAFIRAMFDMTTPDLDVQAFNSAQIKKFAKTMTKQEFRKFRKRLTGGQDNPFRELEEDRIAQRISRKEMNDLQAARAGILAATERGDSPLEIRTLWDQYYETSRKAYNDEAFFLESINSFYDSPASEAVAEARRALVLSARDFFTNKEDSQKFNQELQKYADELKKTAAARGMGERQQTEALKAHSSFLQAVKDFKEGRAPSSEYAAAADAALKAKRAAGADTADSFLKAFRARFEYGKNEAIESIQDMLIQLTDSFETHLNDALFNAISGAKDVKEAFKDMADAMLDEITKMTIQATTRAVIGSYLPSPLREGGEVVKRFQSGGLVRGGSGLKDDVPAVLNAGEYVLKKEAVQKYGVDTVSALNNGYSGQFVMSQIENGFIGALRNAGIARFAEGGGVPDPQEGLVSSSYINRLGGGFHLRNAMVYDDDDYPTEVASRIEIDQRLSRRALMDQNNPRNKIRLEKQKTLYDHLKAVQDDEDQYQEDLRDWESQKKAKRAQLFATILMQLGLNYIGGKGGRQDAGANQHADAANWGKDLRNNRNAQEANWIEKHMGQAQGVFNAEGGINSKDNVPALLMGGEYVMSRDSVQKYGIDSFNKLNRGQLPTFAEGGLVGGDSVSSMGDLGGSSATNNINITVNVSDSGGVSASLSESGETNDASGRQSGRELAKSIEAAVVKTIIDQKRQGGLLSKEQLARR